jgi:hypothetical protein
VGLGKKQDSGFRIQVASTRAGATLNSELWIVSCLLAFRHRLLPTAYCLLLTAYCLLLTAYCLLPTAYCLLPTFKALEQKRHLLLSSECPSRWRFGFFSGGYKGTRFME